MEKYTIKVVNKDFIYLDINDTVIGKKDKRLAIDRKKRFVLFKVLNNEAGKEKISNILGNCLGLFMSKLELAIDGNDLGVMEYLFTDKNITHTDMVMYFNDIKNRNKYYTISNIREVCDKLDYSLFKSFIQMTVFDAWIGNKRKEDNWGYSEYNNALMMSPMYSNRMTFSDETEIYKDNQETKYRYDELIKYLIKKYPEYMIDELKGIQKFDDRSMENIINAVPDVIMTPDEKNDILVNLLARRKWLVNIMKGARVNV